MEMNPFTLRRYCKSYKLPINYTNIDGRIFNITSMVLKTTKLVNPAILL
jgi:hypothetical protein